MTTMRQALRMCESVKVVDAADLRAKDRTLGAFERARVSFFREVVAALAEGLPAAMQVQSEPAVTSADEWCGTLFGKGDLFTWSISVRTALNEGRGFTVRVDGTVGNEHPGVTFLYDGEAKIEDVVDDVVSWCQRKFVG